MKKVNAVHYMAFKHHISFATDLAVNFGCNQFRIIPDIAPSGKLLCIAILSRCAACFKTACFETEQDALF